MSELKIVFLDYATLGGSSLLSVQKLGSLGVYELTPKEEIVSRASDADIIIANKVILDADVLSQLPKLKLICVAATGVNNIDLIACEKLEIAVCNVKGYSTPSVVQIVFSSLLYAKSKISFFDNFVKDGSYSASPTFTCMDEQFSELCGKTFGIIGFGEIGQKVAKTARSFGAKVLYYSTSGQNDKKGYKRVELEELLAKSDVVSIHCALNEKTKNLISTEKISQMRKNAILMNFARGGIVDEEGVANALNSDSLGVYITDVFAKEPMESTSPLLGVKDKSRLVLTPHIGWASVEARDRLIKGVAQNIKAFLDGKRKNRVV